MSFSWSIIETLEKWWQLQQEWGAKWSCVLSSNSQTFILAYAFKPPCVHQGLEWCPFLLSLSKCDSIFSIQRLTFCFFLGSCTAPLHACSCHTIWYLSVNLVIPTYPAKENFKNVWLCIYVCMFVRVASGYVGVPTEWEEGVRVPGAGVTGSSELSDMSAWIWT